MKADWRWGPPLLAVVYNLVVLRDQLRVVPPLNDSAVHLAYARWVRRQMESGHLPLDGWFPNLQLGIAAARHYQTLPDLLTGVLAWPLGVDLTYRLLLYLALATWPISVYVGSRLFGWGWAASIAALVSPLVTSVTGYGYEHSSYTWQGFGLYPQLWAMWLMPLAWGLSWQAVHAGRRLVLASLVLGLTLCCHFLSGYLAFLLVGVWVVCAPTQIGWRLVRAALIMVGALGVAAWVLVPVFIDRAYTLNSEYVQGTFWQDSFGAPRVLAWLASGKLFDSGRWPVLTALAAVGLAVCLARVRMDVRARALIGSLGIGIFLFSGRPTFGALIALLPASKDLLLHRYLMGVQLAGMLLAGVGLTYLAGWLVRTFAQRSGRPGLTPAVTAAAFAAGIAALAPAWIQVARADASFATLAQAQLAAEPGAGADFGALVEEANRLGGGRVYAGSNNDWGVTFRVGYVPAYVALLNHDADLVGFKLRMPSLVADAEAQFDGLSPDQYQLFNVRYVVMPAGGVPPVPATLVDRRPTASLWQVSQNRYLAAIDLVPPTVKANRDDLGRKGGAFLRSADLQQARYHAVAYDGAPEPPAGDLEATGSAATIPSELDSLAAGHVAAEVTADRRSVILLKTAFDPNWRITVDGTPAKPFVVMPGLLGVEVEPGTHEVDFRYQPFAGYLPLFLIAIVVLASVWWLGRRVPARGPASGNAAAGQLSSNH